MVASVSVLNAAVLEQYDPAQSAWSAIPLPQPSDGQPLRFTVPGMYLLRASRPGGTLAEPTTLSSPITGFYIASGLQYQYGAKIPSPTR